MNILGYPSSARTALALGIATLFAAVFGLAGVASAASSTYPAGNASNFADSGGGWTDEQQYDGLCLQGITCPTLSGDFVASGGAQGIGDGFIRVNSGGTTLTALLATSQTIWRSPAFTYQGVGGETPASLTFAMNKRSDYQELLSLGASADFSVVAVNLSGGANRELVSPRTVGTNDDWAGIGQQPLLRNALTVGGIYSIEIRTSIGGLAAVLPSGAIDYDNIVLRASDGSGGGNNGGGNNGGGNNGGGNGKDGKDGKDGKNDRQIRPKIKKAAKGPINLRKKPRARAVRVKCQDGSCRIRKAAARFTLRGKTYHGGKARFSKQRFKAKKQRFIKIRVPNRVYKRVPRGKKTGFLKVRVIAASSNGTRTKKNIAIGVGRR